MLRLARLMAILVLEQVPPHTARRDISLGAADTRTPAGCVSTVRAGVEARPVAADACPRCPGRCLAGGRTGSGGVWPPGAPAAGQTRPLSRDGAVGVTSRPL